MKNFLIVLVIILLLAVLYFGARTIYQEMATPKSTAMPVAGKNTIIINQGAFDPPTLKISEGTTVTWQNEDVTDHTVTFDKIRDIDSGKLAPKDIFKHLFEKHGTYNYHCSLNSKMTGRIIVQ